MATDTISVEPERVAFTVFEGDTLKSCLQATPMEVEFESATPICPQG